MRTVSIRIPQIGEGLQEARLVAVLKQPGERIKRDEAIYQMETDKAVMDVESPYDGILLEWMAAPDDVLPIGAEVARLEVEAESGRPDAEAAPQLAPAEGGPRPVGAGLSIPPRTRAYAKEKGVSESELAELAGATSKLMPSDIDRFLASRSGASPKAGFQERPVPPKQRVLNSRLVRGSQLVVPGTISLVVDWEPIEKERDRVKQEGGKFQPSAFTMFAFAVGQAVKAHPSMRTSLVGEETFRTYETLSLGVAVSLPGDELALAVVEEADSLDWLGFAKRMREKIELARGGKDQANEMVTLSLTNMQNFGLRHAVPVVVPPAVATLFIGEVYDVVEQHEGSPKARRFCNLALTFDHRVLNGVGAANFLNEVKRNTESIRSLLAS